MKTIQTLCPAIVLLATLACLATLAPMAHAQGSAIATMNIDGNNAFVDKSPQPASGRGIKIFDGNLVRTGKDTNALVEIIPEGSVQLNENSAKLITTSFFKGTRCFAVRLITGELFISGENVCFLTNVGAVSGISRSRINIKVDERGTVLTVIQGEAELEQQPADISVSTHEQLIVLPNGEYNTRMLDPSAAERTAEWTKDYFNAPEKKKKKMSKGAKTALGILGAIIFGAAIHEATDDDDDRESPPPTPEPDYPEPTDSEPPEPADSDPPEEVPTSTSDTPQPSDDAQIPAREILQTSPVYVPQLGPCCIGGLNGSTEQLTPAQCLARKGEPGVCTIIK